MSFGDSVFCRSLLLGLKFRAVRFSVNEALFGCGSYLNMRSRTICCFLPPKSSGISISIGNVSCGFPRSTAPKCSINKLLSRPPKFEMLVCSTLAILLYWPISIFVPRPVFANNWLEWNFWVANCRYCRNLRPKRSVRWINVAGKQESKSIARRILRTPDRALRV